jgi:hypothetical protein
MLLLEAPQSSARGQHTLHSSIRLLLRCGRTQPVDSIFHLLCKGCVVKCWASLPPLPVELQRFQPQIVFEAWPPGKQSLLSGRCCLQLTPQPLAE